MKFEPLINYLESTSSLRFGDNLFVNTIPPMLAGGFALKVTEPGVLIDGEMPLQRTGRFQLLAKGQRYSELVSAAHDISELLCLQNRSLPGMEIKLCRPLNEAVVRVIGQGSSFELSYLFFIKYATS